MKLSVVIPSYKDPYLNKTVESLLGNSELKEDELEIICVMDGYYQPPVADKRVKMVHLGKNRGMRGAINAGVDVAKGEYLARFDEHCTVSQGWDRIMLENIEDNWIVTLKRYFLDPVKWELMDLPPVEWQGLAIRGSGDGRKFTSTTDDKKSEQLKDVPIYEIYAMQGSMWCMSRKLWDTVIHELQIEGYGPLYQDSHEMVFKVWKAGGKLMLNKNVWYAHKHRSFSRTHNNGTAENPSNNEKCWAYSLSVWEEYYNELLINKQINQ